MKRRREKIASLHTEKPNPKSEKLDQRSTLQILKIMNQEDREVPKALSSVLPQIAKFVEGAATRMKRGGRLFYIGAGTSGRIGILDASECPPTFGTPPEWVQGLIAGGAQAVFKAIEGAEDSESDGKKSLQKVRLTSNDCVVGLSASGRTPFVLGALKYARQKKAYSASVTCNPTGKTLPFSNVGIVANVGPEVIAGSTRLKCGSAQKMILNMISTTLMVRLGRVSGNRMDNLLPKSEKLWERAKHLVMEKLGVNEAAAKKLLERSGGNARQAISFGQKR